MSEGETKKKKQIHTKFTCKRRPIIVSKIVTLRVNHGSLLNREDRSLTSASHFTI